MGAGQRLSGTHRPPPTGLAQPGPALQHGSGEREAPRNTAVMGESVSAWLCVTPSQSHQWGLRLPLALYYLPFQKLFHSSERTPSAHAAEPQGHCSAVQHGSPDGQAGSTCTEATRGTAPPGIVQCAACTAVPCSPGAPWVFLPCHPYYATKKIALLQLHTYSAAGAAKLSEDSEPCRGSMARKWQL